MLHSGIDLHKNNCLITTVNEAGKIVKQEKVSNFDAAILNYFFSLDDSHQAVVESTPSACHLYATWEFNSNTFMMNVLSEHIAQ